MAPYWSVAPRRRRERAAAARYRTAPPAFRRHAVGVTPVTCRKTVAKYWLVAKPLPKPRRFPWLDEKRTARDERAARAAQAAQAPQTAQAAQS